MKHAHAVKYTILAAGSSVLTILLFILGIWTDARFALTALVFVIPDFMLAVSAAAIWTARDVDGNKFVEPALPVTGRRARREYKRQLADRQYTALLENENNRLKWDDE